jgi:hypothetical protein
MLSRINGQKADSQRSVADSAGWGIATAKCSVLYETSESGVLGRTYRPARDIGRFFSFRYHLPFELLMNF